MQVAIGATALLNAESKTGGSRVGKTALDVDWSVKAQIQRHADSEENGDESSAEKEKWKCFRAGVELCNESGRALSKYKNCILRVLKVCCPKKNRMRGSLVDGDIFLALVRMDALPVAKDFIPDKDIFKNESKILHIAVSYLVPLRPTMQVMECTDVIGDILHLQAHLF